MTYGEIEQAVRDIVVGWLSDNAGPGAPPVDTDQSFADRHVQQAVFQTTLSDQWTAQINAACNSAIALSTNWRIAHYTQPIADFIADAARMVPSQC
jgi:hypothetical protein